MTVVLPRACPHCGRINELHSSPSGGAPEPGDVALCWRCLMPGVFTERGIRKLTEEELTGSQGDSWRRMVQLIAEGDQPDDAVRRARARGYGRGEWPTPPSDD